MKNKTIIVGVTGGIAAYKSADLVSKLTQFGADVWVVMTPEAAKLVTPLTFRTLSGNPVITDLFSEELSSIRVPHISITEKADLIVIAPATANMIGKIAQGIADDPPVNDGHGVKSAEADSSGNEQEYVGEPDRKGKHLKT